MDVLEIFAYIQKETIQYISFQFGKYFSGTVILEESIIQQNHQHRYTWKCVQFHHKLEAKIAIARHLCSVRARYMLYASHDTHRLTASLLIALALRAPGQVERARGFVSPWSSPLFSAVPPRCTLYMFLIVVHCGLRSKLEIIRPNRQMSDSRKVFPQDRNIALRDNAYNLYVAKGTNNTKAAWDRKIIIIYTKL